MGIRVAIAGVGNCASALIQGVEYYKDAKRDEKIPGVMHAYFGDYHISDIEFVAAFEVTAAITDHGALGGQLRSGRWRPPVALGLGDGHGCAQANRWPGPTKRRNHGEGY